MTAQSTVADKQDYYRLITFWVICEAFAGGILHAFKLPFSGMVVGSFAVFCIVMIGKYFPGKGNISKATLLVCIFKLMLSPHSPPTAYIAVLFQGAIGEALFRLRLSLKLTSVLIAVISLVESSVQRILVLWVLYGNKFWEAVGKYLEKFSGDEGGGPIPQQLAIAYITFHAIFGLIAGFYFALLARAGETKELRLAPFSLGEKQVLPGKRKRKKTRWIFVLLWLTMGAFLAYGYAYPKKALLSGNAAALIMFRAISILVIWYFIISPLFMKWFRRKMEVSRAKQLEGFLLIQNMLPSTREIFYQSWSRSSECRGPMRLHKFLKILSANMVPQKSTDKLFEEPPSAARHSRL